MHRNHVYIRKQIEDIADRLKALINWTSRCEPHKTGNIVADDLLAIENAFDNARTALNTIHTLKPDGNIAAVDN